MVILRNAYNVKREMNNKTYEISNQFKTILDLCGGTGAWSKPYADAGYDVRVINLPKQNVIDYIPPKDVYGILAAPPCTMFSIARTTAKRPRDFIEGMISVNACIRIIWQCNPVFWALENPIGLLTKFIGKYKYRFDPWWFGDPWTKRTALWGQFNNPKRKYYRIKDILNKEEYERCRINNRKLPPIRENSILPRITDGFRQQTDRRAITPQGFAKAFFEANQ